MLLAAAPCPQPPRSLPSARGSARCYLTTETGEGERLRWSLAGPSLRDLHIFFYWPLNKTFLGGSERLSPLPPSAGAAAAAREGEGDVAPAPAAGWLRAQPCPARSRCPAALLPCAGRSFFSVVSEFTGFRAADLGAGPVPLHAQEEPRRQRCCRQLHKPAHFFLILFFARISSTSLLSCII